MKNLMRFAMVLALAGSALLYSGCTKDYQKDIDDLNTGVTTLQGTVQKLQEQVSALEALKSQIASLQGDVAPLQAAIDKNTEAIKKLQEGGYVTKDELDDELASLRDDTQLALDALAELVADNVDAIDALKEAYEKTDAVAKALNLGKIASVALVRKYSATTAPANYVALNAWQLKESTTASTALYETSALLNLTYQVSPASLAASLNEDNVALSIYSPKKNNYIDVPVTITDIDEEAGLVSLFANLFSSTNKSNFDFPTGVTDYYTPFALVINDTPVGGGVVNDIKSQYDFAAVSTTFTATTLTYYADLQNIEVPYDKFATSERKFFDGLEFELTYKVGSVDYYMSLDEAAGIFGVDVEVITPTFKKALTITDNNTLTGPAGATGTKTGGDFIKSDKNAWTAAMKATKLDEAKTALDWGATIKATATAYITKDGITRNVWSENQDYSVVNAEGNDVIITSNVVNVWKGKNTIDSDITGLNFVTTKKINSSFFLYRKYTDSGEKYNVVQVKPDGDLVDVDVLATNTTVTGITNPTGYTFANVPFSTSAQDLTFVGTYTENDTDYDVTLTLKLGAKPADKKNLDLGTFKVDGSYTNAAEVDLSGILKNFIGNDTELYKNLTSVAGLPGNLEAVLANGLGTAAIQATAVIVNTDEDSVERTASTTPALGGYTFAFNVPANDPDKGKDKSLLTLPAPTEAGQTYIVSFSFTPFGIKYEGKLKVEVDGAANFALEAVPGYIRNGKILVSYESTDVVKDKDNTTYFDAPIALDMVDFAHYFQLNKVLENESATALDLAVEITLEGDKYVDEHGDEHDYSGNWKINNIAGTPLITLNVKTVGGVYQKALTSDATKVLDWDTYTGTTIKAKATLYKNHTSTAEKVNEVKFEINRELPFKTFGVKNISKAVNFGDGVEVNLADALNLTSILYQQTDVAVTEKGHRHVAAVPADPSTGTPAEAEIPFEFSFASHLLKPDCLGVMNEDEEFVAFKDVTELVVTRNGESATLHKGTDFSFVDNDGAGNQAFVLKLNPNSAVATMTIELPLALKITNTIDYSTAAAGSPTPQYATWSKPVTITLTRE